MALGKVSADPQALMKGLTPIQLEEMVEEYLKKVEPMWVIATCEHDLSIFGDASAASLIGFHWMEHVCPEIGDSSEFMRQAREMLFNSSFMQVNEVDRFKRDHLLKEMSENNRAGWEVFYLLCKYLQIPAMFFLHQGVYVTQDGVFQPQDQRVIFMCGPKERLRVLRPSFHNLFSMYSWSTDPVTAREIMKQSGGKGKGKKSSGIPKRKRQMESLIERSREILGESMEQQEEQPPAKRTSLSREGEPLGLQVITPPEIMTMPLGVTVTTTVEMSPDVGTTMTTATASTSGIMAEPEPAVSEGESIQASTSKEADPQERGTSTTADQTTTMSKVLFILGELHQEKGPTSLSLGASRESFISGESMLLGRGCGRGVRPAEMPAAVPRRPGGRGEPHGPQPGSSGECGEPAPGPSRDSRELKKANEKIQDLEGQVDSLVGIQNNLEIEMETQRVLVQEYEEDLKRMKCDNATVKAQLLTSEEKMAR